MGNWKIKRKEYKERLKSSTGYRAYSNAGKGLILFYLVNAVVSTAVMAGIIIPVMSSKVSIHELFNAGAEGQSLIANILVTLDVLVANFAAEICNAMAAGSACGMAAGICAYMAATKKFRETPEKWNRISAGDFARLISIAFGLWTVGCVIGNLPELLGAGTQSVFSALEYYAGTGGWALQVYGIIAAPVLEELLCRKFLIDTVGRHDTVTACFASALVFGLVHGNCTQFPYAFMLGLLFAVIYINTGNVLYTMAMHAILNLIGSTTSIGVMFGVDLSGPFNILMAVLCFWGLMSLICFRNIDTLKISRAGKPALGTRSSFMAGGMGAFTVFMAVLSAGMGVLTFAAQLLENKLNHEGLMKPHLLLIPVAVTVAIVVLTCLFVGKGSRNKNPESNPAGQK